MLTNPAAHSRDNMNVRFSLFLFFFFSFLPLGDMSMYLYTYSILGGSGTRFMGARSKNVPFIQITCILSRDVFPSSESPAGGKVS